jgi:hypothetical protein
VEFAFGSPVLPDNGVEDGGPWSEAGLRLAIWKRASRSVLPVALWKRSASIRTRLRSPGQSVAFSIRLKSPMTLSLVCHNHAPTEHMPIITVASITTDLRFGIPIRG